jgi:hypothetical protein
MLPRLLLLLLLLRLRRLLLLLLLRLLLFAPAATLLISFSSPSCSPSSYSSSYSSSTPLLLLFLFSSSYSSSSLAYGPYSLTSASFRLTAHKDLSSAFLLHLLTPIDFRSFSVQSNHPNFGLPAFLLASRFRHKYFPYSPAIRLPYHTTGPSQSSYCRSCYKYCLLREPNCDLPVCTQHDKPHAHARTRTHTHTHIAVCFECDDTRAAESL